MEGACDDLHYRLQSLVYKSICHREYRKNVSKGSKRRQSRTGQTHAQGNRNATGQVRIIAGRWRGRKLPVADVQGLRPTGDRVRETLFNWLQADVAGARCLDLFAGSGALGFEALSRYAASVAFIEPDKQAGAMISQSMALLDVEQAADVIAGSAAKAEPARQPSATLIQDYAEPTLRRWQSYKRVPQFDLVFIDPPFAQQSQWSILELLCSGFLADQARVYMESPSSQQKPEYLPEGCNIVRDKQFGDVMARLIHYINPT